MAVTLGHFGSNTGSHMAVTLGHFGSITESHMAVTLDHFGSNTGSNLAVAVGHLSHRRNAESPPKNYSTLSVLHNALGVRSVSALHH